MGDAVFLEQGESLVGGLGVEGVGGGFESIDIFPIEGADGFEAAEGGEEAGAVWAAEQGDRAALGVLEEFFRHVAVEQGEELTGADLDVLLARVLLPEGHHHSAHGVGGEKINGSAEDESGDGAGAGKRGDETPELGHHKTGEGDVERAVQHSPADLVELHRGDHHDRDAEENEDGFRSAIDLAKEGENEGQRHKGREIAEGHLPGDRTHLDAGEQREKLGDVFPEAGHELVARDVNGGSAKQDGGGEDGAGGEREEEFGERKRRAALGDDPAADDGDDPAAAEPGERVEGVVDLEAHAEVVREILERVEEERAASAPQCPGAPEGDFEAAAGFFGGLAEDGGGHERAETNAGENGGGRERADPEAGRPADRGEDHAVARLLEGVGRDE